MTATLLAPPDEMIRLSGIRPILEVDNWLQRSTTIDYLALVKEFWLWVRSQIQK